MLLAILMPALNKVKKIARRRSSAAPTSRVWVRPSRCNANDYEDQFTKQNSKVLNDPKMWSIVTAGNLMSPSRNCHFQLHRSCAQACICWSAKRMLARRASSAAAAVKSAYDGTNRVSGRTWSSCGTSAIRISMNGTKKCGLGPKEHVSYSFQQPFGNFAASGASTASFAIMADKNPWFDPQAHGADPRHSHGGYLYRYYSAYPPSPNWESGSTARAMGDPGRQCQCPRPRRPECGVR